MYIDEEIFDDECRLNILITDSILISEDEECFEIFINDTKNYDLTDIGEFASSSGTDLVLFRKN